MSQVPKERADILLVEKELFTSREQAKRAIMAGQVYVNEMQIMKPGEKVEVSCEFVLKGQRLKYVSRGGLKLEKAIEAFSLDLKDAILLDIGSSTGGFTDCALQNGAKHAYALDVGYNQLDWKIRSDERVTVMERTNFRYSKPEDFPVGLPTVATIDVSFISLHLIFPPLASILVDSGEVVALVKPQFEAGKDRVGKKGIVRDPKVHLDVLEQVALFANNAGFAVQDATFSPITGGEGNIEFLFYLKKSSDFTQSPNFEEIVQQAHQTLNSKEVRPK
ncbi:TlyA family RNA methyltransferase [Chryseomicrobium sp. FSL W7-1435]|uniref:TlyA family RNA methyltransferase n=1 Tax=Chryseomicrobium sp. FSL W7-1435 TaxID=2921704 RepID=UPI00315A6D7B